MKKIYKQKNIINLMSSIQASFDIVSSYNELTSLKSNKLKESGDVILLVIDGLGYEYLRSKSGSLFFSKNLKEKISTVFLATTASGLSTYCCGLLPSEHMITGWKMYLREIGMVTELLSFKTRSGKIPLDSFGFSISDFYKAKSIFAKNKNPSFAIYPEKMANSSFSKASLFGANILPYKELSDMFSQIEKSLKSTSKRKYIFAYWQEFDAICHKYGTNSKETKKHFLKIENEVKKFIEQNTQKNFTMIITADHGLIDYKKENIINLQEHPTLERTLRLPLCGEARTAFCYVKPDMKTTFEKYAKEKLGKYCTIKKSSEAVKEGWFGPTTREGNEQIWDRVGDYLMIMKGNYIVQDKLLYEPQLAHNFKAAHGGISKEEMYVPLIIIKRGINL